jgi:hypothetical protein
MQQVTWVAPLMLLSLASNAACQPPALMWSQPFPGSWTWSGATSYAASLTEAGFTDWRLPTRTELQAALQANQIAGLLPNGTYGIWTRDTRGNRAYAVLVTTDANGTVVPGSISVGLYLKTSGLLAVAVRP